MLRNFFKTAIRSLSRNRVYSFINIAGLSLGLACAMLMVLYLKDEVSYDRFLQNGQNIYRIYSEGVMPDGEVRRMGITGDVQGPLFKEKIPGMAAFVRVNGGYADVKGTGEVNPQQLLVADSNFFSVFSFPLLSGQPSTALIQPLSVVLSEDAAKKYFGTSDALGKTLMVKRDMEFQPYVVSGVAKRCPQNSSLQFDAIIPKTIDPDKEHGPRRWNEFFLNTYVVLNPNASVHAVEQKMTRLFEEENREFLKRIQKETNGKFNLGYRLQPFFNIHLNDSMDRNEIAGASSKVYSYILTGIALFILVIACINFVNLTVARSLKRAKEIGVRKVIGSSRRQLILQFLGESMMLCFAAFLIGIVLVQWLLPVFNRLSNKALSLSFLFDTKLVAGYVMLFVITGLLAGFYPALVLSKFNPVKTLYGRFTLSGKNYLQKSLVVLQFTLASFLISATCILFYQFKFLSTKKLGYDDSNLVMVSKQKLNLTDALYLKDELLKNPNIAGVALKDKGYAFNGGKINGNTEIGFTNATIDESYFPMMKIPIVKGRNFSKDFPSDRSHSVIVNEKFVANAGWKDPIGQKVSIGDGPPMQVVGVVKDYHFQPVNVEIGPALFTMGMQQEYWMVYIKIKPASETASLHHIEATFKKLFPLSPFSYQFKDQENQHNLEAEARWKQIMLFGAILTIFISCIGLFGLTVLSTEKRTREIGIRKVLGASSREVAAILSKDFLKLVLLALLIATPISWLAAKKWLENYPYRIHLSWWLYLSVAVLVVFIAIATVSTQAIRAALINPVKSLKTE